MSAPQTRIAQPTSAIALRKAIVASATRAITWTRRPTRVAVTSSETPSLKAIDAFAIRIRVKAEEPAKNTTELSRVIVLKDSPAQDAKGIS